MRHHVRMPRKTTRPLPEDATSYAEFLERFGSERAAEMSRTLSRATTLRWLIGMVSFWVGFVLLMPAIVQPGASWEQWTAGLGFAAVFLGLVANEIWRAAKAHQRHQMLDRLARRWQERAASGKAPLSSATNLVQRVREEMGKNRALQIPPNATRLAFAEGVYLSSPRLRQFAGAFLGGRYQAATRIDDTLHCVSALTKLAQ